MSWSFRIARIGRTELRMHVTFLLLLAWVGMAYYTQGGLSAALAGVAFILALFGCVVLHELGHVLMARRFGIHTPDITLLPIGGVARLQRMPEKPAQEILVALAGPAVNVVIAGVLLLVLGRLVDPMNLERIDDPRVGFLTKLAVVNIWLVLFNLLPAFPMDGGRVLRASLALFMRYGRATQLAARVGQGMAFLFAFAGLFLNPLLLFIALFVYLGASAESAHAQMRDLAEGLQVSEAMITQFVSLPHDARLSDAAAALVRTTQHEFPVLDPDGGFAGILTRDNMLNAYRHSGGDLLVREVMHTGVPKVSAQAPFGDAFRQMQESQCPALAVVDPGERVIGIITPENVSEMMMIQSALPKGATPVWRTERAA